MDLDLTWQCMVCKETRPDQAISVFKKRGIYKNLIPMTINIRYCNDNIYCVQMVENYNPLPNLEVEWEN